MTATGERFAQIPEAMVKDRDLHHSAFRVYSSIYLHANWDGSWTHISEDVIAEDLGLNRAAIAMQIRTLVERGYLKVWRRQGCRNQYRICPDPSSQLTPSLKEPVKRIDTTRSEPVKPIDGLEGEPVKPVDDTCQSSLHDPSILFTRPVKPLDTVPDSYPDSYPDSFPEIYIGACAPDSPVEITEKKSRPKRDDSEQVRAVFAYYQQRIQPSAKLFPGEKIRKRLETFTVAELTEGIDRFAAHGWWMRENGKRGASWFFHSDPRSEQFLNLEPERKEQSNGNRQFSVVRAIPGDRSFKVADLGQPLRGTARPEPAYAGSLSGAASGG